MQLALGFGAAADMAKVRDLLRDHFGPLPSPPRRTPMGQLVKSLISNRTYDRVSVAAYDKLEAAYDGWIAMAAAPVADLEAWISGVQYADRKALHLAATLKIVGRERPDFDLVFLGQWTAQDAFAWLERLPGVGRKVAASVLNFSTIQRPALVIDTHLKRIFQRLGVAGRRADAVTMYEAVMSAVGDWPASELTQLHVWMKRLGQVSCHHRAPVCADCPLRANCATAMRQAADGIEPAAYIPFAISAASSLSGVIG